MNDRTPARDRRRDNPIRGQIIRLADYRRPVRPRLAAVGADDESAALLNAPFDAGVRLLP